MEKQYRMVIILDGVEKKSQWTQSYEMCKQIIKNNKALDKKLGFDQKRVKYKIVEA